MFLGFDLFISVMVFEKIHFEVRSHILKVQNEKIKNRLNSLFMANFHLFPLQLSLSVMKMIKNYRQIGKKVNNINLEKSGLSTQR